MLSQAVIPYPGPFSPGPAIVRNVLCPDGTARSAYGSPLGADTFYSIPARVYAKGRTVAGYLTMGDTGRVWLFNPYLYRKNWRAVAPESYSTRDICPAERMYKASGEL